MDVNYEQLAQNWEDTALFHHRNELFYKDLIRKTGEHFGVEAHISEDGSIQQEVLALKVPELVEELINKLSEISNTLIKVHQIVDVILDPNNHTNAKVCLEQAMISLAKYKNIQKYENIDENNCCGNCCE